MALRTNYKDFIADSEGRLYRIVPVGDTGLSKITDATTYIQEGDRFGATDLNATNAQVNSLRINVPSSEQLPIASENTLGTVYYVEDNNEYLVTQKILNGTYKYKNLNFTAMLEEDIPIGALGYYYATDTNNWYLDGVKIKPIYTLYLPTASATNLNKTYVNRTMPFLSYGNPNSIVPQKNFNSTTGSYVADYGYVCTSGNAGALFNYDITSLISQGINKIRIKLTIPSDVSYVANKTVSLQKTDSYSSSTLTLIESQTILQSQQIYEFDINSNDFTATDCLAIIFDHPNAVISDIWFLSNVNISLHKVVANYDYTWSRIWNILYVKTYDSLATTYPPSSKYENLVVIVEENNQIYKCTLKDGSYEWGDIGSGGGSEDVTKIVYLTLNEYNALPESQKTDGTVYHIYDD